MSTRVFTISFHSLTRATNDHREESSDYQQQLHHGCSKDLVDINKVAQNRYRRQEVLN